MGVGDIYKFCGNREEYTIRIIDLGGWTPLQNLLFDHGRI